MNEHASYDVVDGLTYALPILAPRSLKEALASRPEIWREYLREGAAQTFRFQFDTPQRTGDDLPFLPPTEDPLREWNIATRRYVLEQTHAAAARNPIAKRAVGYIGAFVVGEGFSLTCRNPEVERVLQDFIDDCDNDIRTYERQAVIDLLVDGEIFLRLAQEEGITIAAPQRPWECTWIKTERGFFRRRIDYHFEYETSEGDAPTGTARTEIEDVAAEEIIHVAINRHGYELRGRPELFAALPWLRAHKEWLENRARQNHWRTAFLWLVKVKAASPQVIAAVSARWRRPPSPGSISVESDRVEVEALSNPVQAADASEDGRQLKLMTAVAFGLPEYFLADGANANLASSTSQQMPALTSFADFQRTLIEELWYPLFRKVIDHAVESGRLPEMVEPFDPDGTPEEGGSLIFAQEAYSIAYKPLVDSDKLALAQALDICARNEWVDNETASTSMGFDYGIVSKRLAAQQQRNRDDIAAGIRMAPPIPRMNPNTPEEEEEEEIV